MSRTNRSRGRRSHSYRSNHLSWPKMDGNRRVRHEVHQRLKDVIFTDAFDEKQLPETKEHLFDRWYYD